MREYVSDAIILNKWPQGTMDSRYAIFTKKFGKIMARATSSRKITSKLAGHLEPGMRSRVRLIELHGVRVVDALKEDDIVPSVFRYKDLAFLDRLLAEFEPEPFIWAAIERGVFEWRVILASLGWDADHTACSICGSNPVVGFSVFRQDFFCARCAVRMPRREMIDLHPASVRPL